MIACLSWPWIQAAVSGSSRAVRNELSLESKLGEARSSRTVNIVGRSLELDSWKTSATCFSHAKAQGRLGVFDWYLPSDHGR